MMVWVDLVLWLPVLTVIQMTWRRLDERPLGYIIALIIYLVPALYVLGWVIFPPGRFL